VPTTPARQLASALGPFGVWTSDFDRLPARRVAEVLAAVEKAGVPAVWFGEGGGSDRIIDAVVAWGDVDTVVKRLDEHRAAAADHMGVFVLSRQGADFPLDDFERLAPALVGDRSTTERPS
jgi:hypothetical protein